MAQLSRSPDPVLYPVVKTQAMHVKKLILLGSYDTPKMPISLQTVIVFAPGVDGSVLVSLVAVDLG